MIKAFQKGQAFLDDVAQAGKKKDCFHIWWLGQSGYLVQWQGQHALIDPYLSDSLTKKYAATDKPHVRMSELVIAPDQLNFIDVVSSSHNHTDHLDGETLIPLLKVNPEIKLIIPAANRTFVANRLSCETSFPIGLNDGDHVQVGHFTFTGIPAAHNELERDEKGKCKFMGYVLSFGPYHIYHSGDTLWRQEILDALNPFSIDLALLPINGNKPERRVAGNLNPQEAVALAKQMGANHVFPCHYDMFTFNTEDPSVFEKEARKQNQNFQVLKSGEGWSSSPQ